MRRGRLAALTTTAAVLVVAAPPPAGATPQAGLVTLPAEAGQVILGPDVDARLGATLSAAGDVDGDKRADLVTNYTRYPGGASPPQAQGVGVVLRGGLGGVQALTGVALPPALGYELRSALDLTPTIPAIGAASAVGDVNGDGLGDTALRTADQVTVVFGTPGPRSTVSVDGDGSGPGLLIISGFKAGTVAAAGDMNGDGVGDLALGSAPSGTGTPGQVLVVFGSTAPLPEITVGGPTADGRTMRIEGPLLAGAGAGNVKVSKAGDVNGDGIGDLVIGAAAAVDGQGRAAVVYGSPTPPASTQAGTDMPQSRGFAVLPPPNVFGTRLGWAVTDAGDVNGDGLADIAVSGPGSSGASVNGFVWTVFGRAFGGPVTLGQGDFSLGQVLVGTPGFGAALDDVGDVNGDKRSDLVIGVPSAGTADIFARGTAVVVYGASAPGLLQRPDGEDATRGFVVSGPAAPPANGIPTDATLGAAVAGLGDGRIAISAPGDGGGSSGIDYVISGRAPTRLRGLLSFGALAQTKIIDRGATLPVQVSTSEAADVRLSLFRVRAGRTCVADTTALTTAQRCHANVTALGGTTLGSRSAGSRTVSFTARLKGKALPAGTYLAVLRAGVGGKRSLLKTISFRIRG
jgi:hypothetical protein